jgi:hypothetical protein
LDKKKTCPETNAKRVRETKKTYKYLDSHYKPTKTGTGTEKHPFRHTSKENESIDSDVKTNKKRYRE